MSVCFCGSQKSFYDCCLKEIQKEDLHPKKIKNELQKLHRNYFEYGSIKNKYKCMYPSCQEIATGSHSISEKSQLGSISLKDTKDGSRKVIHLKASAFDEGIKFNYAAIGNEVFKMPLFCKPHDYAFFNPVDEMHLDKEINKDTASIDQVALCASYRSLCATKRLLEIDLEIMSSKEYQKLQYLRGIAEIKEDNLPISETEMGATIGWYIDETIKETKQRISGISNSISHMDRFLSSEVNKKGSFFSTPYGTMIIFSSYCEPPIMVSSILGTGTTKSGDEYANSISTIKLLNGHWAYAMFCPNPESETNSSAIEINKVAEDIKEASKKDPSNNDLALKLLVTIFSSCENISISPEWWESLNEDTQEMFNVLANKYSDSVGLQNTPIFSPLIENLNINKEKKRDIILNYEITYCGFYVFDR